MSAAQPAEEAWIVYCDGSALPNPGRIGIGAILIAPDGTRHEISERGSIDGCNNQAEGMALMRALDVAKTMGAQRLRIYSDSDVLVQDLHGIKRSTILPLRELFDVIGQQIAALEACEIHWLPRHRNSAADALARAALGLQPKPSKTKKRRKRRG